MINTNNISKADQCLSEFTKRKSWSQKIIQDLKDLFYVLSPTTKIIYCSNSSDEIVGYSPGELTGHSITDFLHVDDIEMYIRDLDKAIRKQRKFSLYFRFRRKDERVVILEATGHPYFSNDSNQYKCFFTMARPYPNKNTSILDSYFELKIENVLLKRKFREQKNVDHQNSYFDKKSDNEENVSNNFGISSHNTLSSLMTELCHSEPKPEPELGLGLELELEPEPKPESFETFRHPTLPSQQVIITTPITPNDVSITSLSTLYNPLSEPKPDSIKVKKSRIEENDFVCTDCGTFDSPEWRKGPLGPKTLCNACGLRWAKKLKKDQKY